jgi:flavin reductase (DIM6/NTAB) family NADH-FMN oxidoreductase RutF
MTFSDDKISQGERFKQINFTKSSILKIPYIEHSIGYLEAIYYKSLEIADHLVFFTKVINVKLFNNKKKPLIYYKRNYTTII